MKTEEELNEQELEEMLYSMLHHVDHTQNNVNESQQKSNAYNSNTVPVESAPNSTVWRYWRTGPNPNVFQKVSSSKEPAVVAKNTLDNPKTKEVVSTLRREPSLIDLSILQNPEPQIIQKTIHYIDHDDVAAVVLESSDEDEVVEVVLPPKPTITIESSDEEDLVPKIVTPTKSDPKSKYDAVNNNGDRDLTASPVASVVSSVSDEFIRSDCIALKISSRNSDNHSFDFSLHGTDLVVQDTPSKKRKKKRNKESVTSTPIASPAKKPANNMQDVCFATPKSKAKNKKQRKSVTERNVTLDVFDSDSNQSIDSNKTRNTYIVTNSSLPNVDVYESDSNQSEIQIDNSKSRNSIAYEVDSCESSDERSDLNTTRNITLNSTLDSVDLTGNSGIISLDTTGINESIVVANVTGFNDSNVQYDKSNQSNSYGKNLSPNDISKFISSRTPAILNEDLDFDNIKRGDEVIKKNLHVDMDKFYNESWGGENFDHIEILKHMSRDRNLWAIDAKDRMLSQGYRRPKCNFCNRAGHRDDACRLKPLVCHMCGAAGHSDARCPNKICLNCGAQNFMFSSMCARCRGWRALRCAECGGPGHPASHCPDRWRRYHNTTRIDEPLEMCKNLKRPYQQFCSGCTRRGHLVHDCRVTVPFSALPINTPVVQRYEPIFTRKEVRPRSKSFSQDPPQDRNERFSSSPTTHETHVNKRRNLSLNDPKTASPVQKTKESESANNATNVVVNTTALTETPKRNVSDKQTKMITPVQEAPKDTDSAKKKTTNANAAIMETPNRNASDESKTPNSMPKSPREMSHKSKHGNLESSISVIEKPLNGISMASNRDNEGHLIQDNEVSDTSDVVTSARIYVTNEIIANLKTKDGENWLKGNMEKLNVSVTHSDVNSFLTIKGKVADQETFQSELRDWTSTPNNPQEDVEENTTETTNLPKNRNNLLRQLDKALDLLKQDLGDPKALYRELTFSQNKHEKLLRQKIISPKTLHNSRTHINDMLKKLNTILLGQAGLADGSAHVSELQSYRQKLVNCRHKKISSGMRSQIADHYHRIFTSSARDDYSELVNKYYLSKYTPKQAKKKKNKNKQNSIIVEDVSSMLSPNKCSPTIDMMAPTPNMSPKNKVNNGPANYKIPPHGHLRKLIAYYQKLHRAKPKESHSKRERVLIMRRIHNFIVSLNRKENVTSKLAKKMSKAENDAHKFLFEM